MNVRSLTRGDAVVIAAAVLLFIMSFLPFYSAHGDSLNSWHRLYLPMVTTTHIAGLIGGGLMVFGRVSMPNRKVAGLSLVQWGTALAVFSLWSAFWSLFSSLGDTGASVSHGIGCYLSFVFALVLAATAVASHLVPALSAPLVSNTPKPQPYGYPQQPGQPQGGYGYPQPGAQQPGAFGQPQQAAFGQPQAGQQPQGGYGYPQPGAAAQQQAPAAQQVAQPVPQQQDAPAGGFSPFWFAVPETRPLTSPDNASPAPIAELTPGVWYLAVEQRGNALVAETQDGRRGLLANTANIQRG